MPKRGRAKKKTTESDQLSFNAGKLGADTSIVISRELLVAAPAAHCFEMIMGQLEEAPQWDPMIVEARPVSRARRKSGATSHVRLDLGGRKLEALAMISLCRPNRAVTWISSEKPRVTEDWRLESRLNGTLVSFTLCYIAPSIVSRFLDKLRRRKRVDML